MSRVWDPHRRAYSPRYIAFTPFIGAALVGVATYEIVGWAPTVWLQLILIAVMTAVGVSVGLVAGALQMAIWRVRHPAKYPCCPECPYAILPLMAQEAGRQRKVAQWQ